MKPNDLLKIWASKAEVARVLGLAAPSVQDWFEAGEIPEARQYQVQLASDGRLQADRPAARISVE